MEFDDFKLFFIIVFAGMTLLLVNNALDKKKLSAFSGGVDASKSTSRSYQQSSALNFDEQLALAVEKQKALQANSIKNKVDNYMSALKEKYTKKEFALDVPSTAPAPSILRPYLFAHALNSSAVIYSFAPSRPFNV